MYIMISIFFYIYIFSAYAARKDCPLGYAVLEEKPIYVIKSEEMPEEGITVFENGRFIRVIRKNPDSNEGTKTVFHETNRNLQWLRDDAGLIAFRHFYNIDELIGKIVIDTGSGTKNNFVKDLRNYGVNAYGVDLHIHPNTPYAIQADISSLPLASNSVDIIYNHYNIFYGMYVHDRTKFVREKALNEFYRVLRVGGKVRILGIQSETKEEFLAMVAAVEGFQTNVIGKNKMDDWAIEITKIK